VIGAAGVAALVLLGWAVGTVAVSAWTQSWNVVKRGHFRIMAWSVLLLGGLSLLAVRGTEADSVWPWAVAFVGMSGLYLIVQYSRTDLPGVVVGAAAGIIGVATMILVADSLPGWPVGLASLELIAGALLLGAVSNGMLLGHWYLNQPGLKPWALGRLSDLCLAGVAASAVLGLVAVGRLAGAETEGAVLGLHGFGDSFGVFFYGTWISLLIFTGLVSWMARRCVKIRSIQSATGLFYVAILTAGVSEFLVRYLMVNAA
jgi:hypothetical protein